MNRLLKWSCVGLVLVLALVLVAPVLADVRVKSVSPDSKMLTVTDKDGKDWTYHLADNAKIFTSTGKEGSLRNLQAGDNIELLWEKRGDRYYTNAILQRQGAYQNYMLAQGTVQSVAPDQEQVVVTDVKGKNWPYHVASDSKITLNNKGSRLNDLKTGDKVMFIYEKKGNNYTIHQLCDMGH
jgi:Cu/Ag efflux protein CusF